MMDTLIKTSITCLLILSTTPPRVNCNAADDKWSFVVFADWHNAEVFAKDPGNITIWNTLYDQLQYIKRSYGGDLVVLPGDSNTGKWDTEEFEDKFGSDLTVQERIVQAGQNCYGTMRELFADAGYERMLMAVGDHEIGGNRWNEGSTKVEMLKRYREGFDAGFNREPETGEFLYQKPIGSVPSTPLNTPFHFTSYAYQHKNVLFITLDAFLKKQNNYIDKKLGLGGEGIVTCTVEGEHLEWFESVLQEARSDETIKHIIVQAHLPIIQPVRKVSTSGQFMDEGEESALWKTMVKYGVDIYLAGEVHTNTVTKDPNSDLLQIVSRGNSYNNFLKIEVTDDTLNVVCYNEVGPKAKYNKNYEAYGNVFVNKGAHCKKQKQSKGVIACGSGESKVCGNSKPKSVAKNSRYPVRCCSDSSINSPSNQYNVASWCPYAATCFFPAMLDELPFSVGVAKNSCPDGLCSGKITYKKAKKLCAAAGGSICTVTDLEGDCAKWTGCNYENKFVWATQDEVPRCNRKSTRITSSGVLKLLDRASALVYFDFKREIFLKNRQVVGMHHDDEKEQLVGKRITIRGKKSFHSLPNKGSFGQPYDAQIANVKLTREKTWTYAEFTRNSRLGIYGTGPHSGGSVISYALWIKTSRTSEMILVHYGSRFGQNKLKNFYILTLKRGNPLLYISRSAILKPQKNMKLNDGNWHHIAVSMPRKSCSLSEVIMYIDGDVVKTTAKKDNNIFFMTSGSLSIGGFGYSHESYEKSYPNLKPYIGMIDEFYMWGRPIKDADLRLAMKR